MQITKSRNGDELTVWPAGRLDTLTSGELESFLKEELPGTGSLILDLKDLEYISSAGLRVILSAHKTMMTQGTMKIINVNEIISEIFSVTGFTDVLDIE